ncbi:MAG: FHA domain-containing protein [Phycisphaerales bacterium]|nr:FHA domain-containing protein [Phycisphaerales bacterium]
MASILIERAKDGTPLLDFDLVPGRGYTIGRSDDAKVRLDAGSISRLHALLFQYEGQWRLSDLGSNKGLLINGSVERECILDNETGVGIGPTTLWFFDEAGNKRTPHHADAFEENAQPLSILRIQHRETGARKAFALVGSKVFSIGTSDSCNIGMQGPGITPLHAVVFQSSNTWHVTMLDEGSVLDRDSNPTRSTRIRSGTPTIAGPLEMQLLNTIVPRTTEPRSDAPTPDRNTPLQDDTEVPEVDEQWDVDLD